jgi:hypothetical protein
MFTDNGSAANKGRVVMGLISEYIGFATQDGTVRDAGTYLLLGGPVMIALLALTAAYNGVIATANGARRTVRLAVKARHHLAARGGVAALRPSPPVASVEAAGSADNTVTVAGAAYALPRKRSVAKV